MFTRASTLLSPILALSSVVATASEPIAARGGSSCNNGIMQCCAYTYPVSYHALLLQERTVNHSPVHLQATQANLDLFQGLLGIVGKIPLIGPLLAISCFPLTGLSLYTGGNCAQQSFCCQNTYGVSPMRSRGRSPTLWVLLFTGRYSLRWLQ